MKKLVRRVGLCFLIAALFWCGTLIADRERLDRELIRLHVVAASDSAEDQTVKLRVRDAVLQSLEEGLRQTADVEAAKAYIQENLPKIQRAANLALAEAGVDAQAVASFCRERFETRAYDTFTLPAGVYESLRIVIGPGKGQNWWCVAFPSLCLPATASGFHKAAQTAGFPDSLTQTLAGEEPYAVRFYLLDVMGRLENVLLTASGKCEIPDIEIRKKYMSS